MFNFQLIKKLKADLEKLEKRVEFLESGKSKVHDLNELHHLKEVTLWAAEVYIGLEIHKSKLKKLSTIWSSYDDLNNISELIIDQTFYHLLHLPKSGFSIADEKTFDKQMRKILENFKNKDYWRN